MNLDNENEILKEDKTSPTFSEDELPFVTIIIPTLNCAQDIPLTVDSVIEQNYPRFEIIAIDAGSTDRTVDLLQSYEGDVVKLASMTEYNVYKMINMGLFMAKGEYINIIFPGDFYIHRHTLLDIMNHSLENQKPDLVYCGTLLRDGKTEVKFLYRELSLDYLRVGQQPTSLQGCWFKRNVFNVLGGFRTDFKLRGGFDFLCRFYLSKKFSFSGLHRALTDYDLRWVTSRMVVNHFRETMKTIYRYFGAWTVMHWLLKQKDTGRFFRLWFRRVKIAFFGR
ncbi:MAG: glycosyltransferase [Parachlamydiaceae bacterium]|nr:glycosyltransferase [Parachlamydiaceae bacterium]